MPRYSGTIASMPPYAPSTCSHTFSRRQISAIAGTGSMLDVLVVPTVATQASGRNPFARSAAIAAASASGRMRNWSSSLDLHDVLESESERERGLVDRRVRVRRAVDAEPRQIGAAGHAALANGELRLAPRAPPRARASYEIDAVSVVMPEPTVAQAEHLTQPIRHDLLRAPSPPATSSTASPSRRASPSASRREFPAPSTTSRSSRRTPGDSSA